MMEKLNVHDARLIHFVLESLQFKVRCLYIRILGVLNLTAA